LNFLCVCGNYPSKEAAQTVFDEAIANARAADDEWTRPADHHYEWGVLRARVHRTLVAQA
jgi:hypothetical protein